MRLKYNRIHEMKFRKVRRKAFLLMAMLLCGGMASAQVLVKGNVYGGCELGQVTGDASVTVSGGTIGDKIPLADRKADANGQVTRISYGNVYGGGNGYDGTDYSQSAPSIDRNLGRVQGNTTVTVNGGVVRHAVYGGGNLGTVGIIDSFNSNGTANYSAGGKTTVTIDGNALIGPTKADLTTATLTEIQDLLGNSASLEDLPKYVDTAFKYLGGNEGMVFGGSRGISGDEVKELSFADTTEVIIQGSANVVGNVFGGGENGHVQKGTGILVQGSAVIGGVELHGTKANGTYEITSGIYAEGGNVTVHLINTESYREGELIEDEFGVGRRVFRGNVFGGGKGNDFVPWLLGQEPPVQQYSYTSGDVYGNATVKVQGGTIYNKVYGGGTMASVGTFLHTDENNPHAVTGIVKNSVTNKDTGQCYVEITGGQIGTNGCNNGDVFGGGRGAAGKVHESGDVLPIHQTIDMAYVGHTHVTVDGASIKSNVYGGSANGHVQGNAKVLIKETTTGTTVIGTEGNGGWHSNVFGGGGGTARYREGSTLNFSITSGRVFGNTDVEITGGKVWHNVYGGGAIASVGTYDASSLTNPEFPYISGGHATVTITGGEIGSDGNENGMVFGSGRGEIAAPGNFLDYVTYVAYSEVNIGTNDGAFDDLKINGSVYGSGENGHVYLESVVNVYSGTIGCTLDEYKSYANPSSPTYNSTWKTTRFPYRGNVYGAGCGTDEYATYNLEHPVTHEIALDPVTNQPITIGRYNPLAGITQGNTKVNIYGGYISHNVYGGGAMASVGLYSVGDPHDDPSSEFSLSWPYKFTYSEIYDANHDPVQTGKTDVTVYGGHIGTYCDEAWDDLYALANSGDVYGGSRGMAGDRLAFVPYANVRESDVKIAYTSPASAPSADGNFIVNSVFGGGQNGHVYDSTTVIIDNGFIGGTVFGGGKGKDMYWDYLKVYDPDHPNSTYPLGVPTLTQVHSITAGKVFGNTKVVVNNGTVQYNVFGGGEYASVGIGNYFGYGELTTDPTAIALTTTTGTTTVKINGGTIGTLGYPDPTTYNIGNGFVYGSSKGIVFSDVKQPTEPPTPRFDYSRDFFLGYTNNTEVIIGDATATSPTIKGSVFGGGEDGHVRYETDVKVKKGTIGEAYSYAPGLSAADSIKMWVYRGNVYGAGRGIDKIASGAHAGEFCSSAGSVTLNTNVTIEGGIIYRNVYGGGSNASVGPPPTDYNPGTSLCKVNIKGGTIGKELTINGHTYVYGGNVFGAGRGHKDLLTTNFISRIATASNTQVNIDSLMHGNTPIAVADVKGNVFGGGEIGQVKQEALVNMKNGTVEGSVYGGGSGDFTDEKAALVLGHAIVNMTGGQVERSIYGGGELASVGTYNYTTVSYNDEGNPNGNNGTTVQVPESLKTTETGLANPEMNGLTKVLISGGQVGLDNPLMPTPSSDDDFGYVFAGGRGEADSVSYPKAIGLAFVNTTYLEISGDALIAASAYGGCENGLTLDDTYVKIAGGQIGIGYNKTANSFDGRYADDKWTTAIQAVNGGTIATALATAPTNGGLQNYFHECDHFPYGVEEGGTMHYYIYDIYAGTTGYNANGGSTQGANGHTFFGNVFGGGSGYYPFAAGKWRRSAGQVNGDTKVEITGGHILSNVFGGNEYTDVLGTSTVEMKGGTVGMPRTIDQITANPITGMIYGGSMGDPRRAFDKWGNVNETQVTVTGGTVFGSIFGGAAVGHVKGDAVVTINNTNGNTLIGTWGYSGFEGNVFGGGKGDELDIDPVPAVPAVLEPPTPAIPAHANFALGRVGGNASVTMSQGKVLGNVYGGGFSALTGVGENGSFDAFFIPETNPVAYDSTHHGKTTVTISGGTIGNLADDQGLAMLRSANKVGNVYGGGSGNPNEYREDDLGRAANAEVSISGSPTIYGSVFGGGQMANVGHWNSYGAWYTKGTGLTSVTIEDTPTIGTELEFSHDDYAVASPLPTYTIFDTIKGMRMISHTRTGNVYGGGQGDVSMDSHGWIVGLEQGHCRQTYVNIDMDNSTATSDGGRILGSVFGGTEEGAVWGNTEVHIAGGTIGTTGITYDSLEYVTDHWEPAHTYSTYSHGNVFGGSYGKDFYKNFSESAIANTNHGQAIDSVNYFAGHVYGKTSVEITGGAIRGNVFGGGDMASVGCRNKVMNGDELVDVVPAAHPDLTAGALAGQIMGNATVTVSGTAVIGPLDYTGLNAYVFGGGKGISKDPTGLRKTFSNVNNTFVTVSGGKIWGSVFGGGSDSHVLGNATVEVHANANIGKKGITTWDGNIFGGGRNFQNTNHTNGRVAGNVNITMDGGAIQGTIFGGGRMALTGVNVHGEPYLKSTEAGMVYDSVFNNNPIHGLVTINITNDTIFDPDDPTVISSIHVPSIGNPNGRELLCGSDESVGDVFGSGKGDTGEYMDIWAGRVANTKINISGSPRIYGSVFGGGEMASVGYWHEDPTTHKQVFYENSGTAEVTIGRLGKNDNPVIGTDMEFRYDYTLDDPEDPDDGPSYWTVYGDDGKLIHTCTGNVYGGAQGDVDTLATHWVSMARSRRAKVVINGGTIKSRVFGGAEQGSLAGNARVIINGGTIGSWANTDDDDPTNNYLFGGVYGGGYGSHNPIFNGTETAFYHTAITNDSTTVLNTAYPDQDLWTADHLAGRVYGNTHVDVLGGTIQGDVFGGASFAYIGGYGNSPKGDAKLYIGSVAQSTTYDPTKGPTILGGVFGANDHSGTPFGDVEVHVYNTKHITTGSEANEVPDNPVGGWTHQLLETNTLTQKYALQEVYGGGNNANFTPNQSGRTTTPRSTTVHVYTCYNTIRDLYGGGKSADIGSSNVSANSNVIVDGGRFYRIFGGGNGSLGDPLVAANTYGTAMTNVKGGVINEVYGGNNQYGNINNIDLKFNDGGQTECDEYVDEIFAGSNESPLIGDIVAELKCGEGTRYEFYGGTHNAVTYGNITLNVYGGTTTNVFGGSMGSEGHQADIKKFPNTIPSPLPTPGQPGYDVVLDSVYRYMQAQLILGNDLRGKGGNITVNLYGGTITNLYGACNVNGNVEGKILINVIDVENPTCPLDVTNIYGGSRQAVYEPIDPTIASPIVNVVHVKEKEATSTNPYIPGIRGNVFGGSYGHKEAGQDYQSSLKANPVVNIGYNAATMSSYLPVDYIMPATRHVRVCGNVYGGGEEGIIDGNTTVNVYEGTIGTIEYTKSNESGPYDGINHLTGGDVYGGSKGCIYNPDHGRVKGNSFINMSGGIVYNNVYGGGEISSVGEREAILGTGENPPIIDYKPKANGKATVTITGGQVGPAPITGEGYNIPVAVSGSDGMVFGGCKGESDDYSLTYKEYSDVNETEVVIQIPSEADITTNRIWGSVFGGGEDGHVLGNAKVRFLSGTVGTTGTAGYDGNVFGGGRNYLGYDNWNDERKVAGRVRGNATIEMNNGHVKGNIYGGGSRGSLGFDLNGNMLADNAPDTFGHTNVTISGGEIGTTVNSESSGSVFGGGMGIYRNEYGQILGFQHLGRVKQTLTTISNDAVVHGSVFGGGEIALVDLSTTINITGGTIGGVSAIDSHNYGSVYGGGKGYVANPYYLSYPLAGQVGVSTEINMSGGQVYENVFGGGKIASVGSYSYDFSSVYENEVWVGVIYDEITNVTEGTGSTTINITGGTVGPLDGTGLNGYIYGGSQGLAEDYQSYYKAYANVVNTEVNVSQDEGKTTRIYGSIFGGSADGHVLGDVSVTLSGGTIGTDGTTSWDGNIFGGGRNFSRANYTAGRVGGNINVKMTGGHLLGSLFGGGRNAGTGVNFNGMVQTETNAFQALESGTSHGNVKVKVSGGEIGNESLIETFTSSTMGDVFGGGKGTMEGIVGHPVASALLVSIVKNTEVIITDSLNDDGTLYDSPIIYGNVYGGGEVANVGNNTWSIDPSTSNIINIGLNQANGEKGLAKVTISGGRIGVDRMRMHYDLVGGDGDNKFDFRYNTVGNVFGGGRGFPGDPTIYPKATAAENTVNTVYGDKYLMDVMAAVGSTFVTITDTTYAEHGNVYKAPWVKGSVYAGSPMGHVMGDTRVRIKGGQIGAGDDIANNVDLDPYYDGQFINPATTPVTASLPTTHHWPYESTTLRPFDPVMVSNGLYPTDGKTWFGNVYGGGSGYAPYVKNEGTELEPNYVTHWNRESGRVYGNSKVEISGGHILSCVYGGCETTDVGQYTYSDDIHGDIWSSGGTATIEMSGGTVGVPRITSDNQAHPVPGYVYGSGKGDPRLQFNTWTNVHEANITMTGGIIYGCLFGGGEDGHVLGNVTINVSETDGTNKPTVIGSTGVSKADGNIFGAGRGTTAEALTAGSVGGNVILNVSGGNVLGNVYGGGNRGSVGTYLVDAQYEDPENPGTMLDNPYYGKIREDDPANSKTYGYTTITVSGGRIGNNNEVDPTPSNPTTVGGYVFGGGRGIFKAWSGSGPKPIWPSAARVKQTNVTINGTAEVKASVYGGGQLGSVRNNAEVNVSENCTIGTHYGTEGEANHYHFGSVYGGGQGYEELSNDNDSLKPAVYLAGRVYGNSTVNISGGHVMENVFGGGEVASTGWVKADGTLKNGLSSVRMTGGQIGPLDGTGLNGFVYGGPEGGRNGTGFKAYANSNTASVEVEMDKDDGTHANRIWGTVFGGAAIGHVLGNASVTLTDGTIGTDGLSGYDGSVFGGGKGNTTSYSAGRVGGNTHVTMEDGEVLGCVYGGGDLALTGVDEDGNPSFRFAEHPTVYDSINHGKTLVEVKGGTIGTLGNNEGLCLLESDYSVGDIFGGGRGDVKNYNDILKGRVSKTEVKVTGTPTIYCSVFGGGEIAGVGYWTDATGHPFVEGTGMTEVTIGKTDHSDNPTIGLPLEFSKDYLSNPTDWTVLDTTNNAATLNYPNRKVVTLFHTCTGNVFGASQGDIDTHKPHWISMGRSKRSEVTINSGTIKSSVFGGAEQGTVIGDTKVTVTGGTIGQEGLWSRIIERDGTEYEFVEYGRYSFGSLFGGGYGVDTLTLHQNDSTSQVAPFELVAPIIAGRVYGNTNVSMTGGAVRGNVFGGGNMASVGRWDSDFVPVANTGRATVSISGTAVVGPLDGTGLNAYVFGGGKGLGNDPDGYYKNFCNVNSTVVTVDLDEGGHVDGSLFGGGSDCHVLGDASVTLSGGLIGTDGLSSWDGNIFGGGRNYQGVSLTAGRVAGNITVTMTGGTLKGSIFGGGRQALTGINNVGVAYTTNTGSHGNITVNVSAGTIGTTTSNRTIGHVFGGGKGNLTMDTSGDFYKRLGEVRSTAVTIEGNATVNGSVYGGSENGHVLENTTVTINETSTSVYPTIGANANEWQGNVFGGGRGTKPEDNGDVYNPYAGRVYGQARANINGGLVKNDVFGGADRGIVVGERIANISGGTINGDVFGGSNIIPEMPDPDHPGQYLSYPGHGGLKTLNVRGGHILGNVYGSSYNAREGIAPSFDATTWTAGLTYYSSFVNITGGTIDHDVYGAGYGGTVYGSNCVNIGLTAIENAPTYVDLNAASPVSANTCWNDGVAPTRAKVKILGSIYDGSDHYGSGTDPQWNHYDIAGYSYTFLDGTGYDTEHDEEHATAPYMNIAGGLYGCGTLCESGKKGREMLVRNYGARSATEGVMNDATRTMTTIQRGGIVLLDNSNIHLSGASDISGQFPTRNFAVLQVDNGFYVANASGIVLGEVGNAAYMDSIRQIRSVYLEGLSETNTTYKHLDGSSPDYELVGLTDSELPEYQNKLYLTETDPCTAANPSAAHALSLAQENVIIFNGISKLFVRYHDNADNKKKYGPLFGFFRMSSPLPYDNLESFACARPKLTNKVNSIDNHPGVTWNEGDGGFLSYTASNNFFTRAETVWGHTYVECDDGGLAYTRRKQYPYYNFKEVTKSEEETGDYRVWALPSTLAHRWYVDGRGIGNGGWGKDESHEYGWGSFPDMPKLTITGVNGIYNDDKPYFTYPKFNPAEDVIFVVGPIDSSEELEKLNQSMLDSDPTKHYPLRLYRYPGGHPMSNENTDTSVAGATPGEGGPPVPFDIYGNTYSGLLTNAPSSTKGPGANLDKMIHVKDNLVMDNVLVNGLYDYGTYATTLIIPTSGDYSYVTARTKVSEPMVFTESGTTLTLKGGTTLTGGYNNIDASGTYSDKKNYYLNPDFDVATVHNGGALYVNGDASTTVNVEGQVFVTRNWQKNGEGTIASNVYLPTFDKSLTITNALTIDARIGVTSPKRNTAKLYVDNTFSPIAVANDAGIANTAWNQNNFSDDMDCFFTRKGKSTYYNGAGSKDVANTTLYLGWTWANVVRTAPTDFAINDINSAEDMAWLISKSAGMNGETATDFEGETIKQTADIDMQQYVWVPIGTSSKPFKGTFDGQGHLIDSLFIEYLSINDGRYQRTNYGLFGNVNGGKIKRTFVVGGMIKPESVPLSSKDAVYHIGGLVGQLDGATAEVSNSESAIKIECPDYSDANNVFAGGLVGQMNNGLVHSSMAMSEIVVGARTTGLVGGLVGSSEDGDIYNSFVNGNFGVSSSNGTYGAPVKIGGLLGSNSGAKMSNCYVALQDFSEITSNNFGSIAGSNMTTSNIDNCYVMQNPSDKTFEFVISGNGSVDPSCHKYTPVIAADNLGYMYADNKIEGISSRTDTTMFQLLNKWAADNSTVTTTYARWARPALAYYETVSTKTDPEIVLRTPINGDLPVLLLCDPTEGSDKHQGDFRSVGTYAGGPALQYGGPVRDGNELAGALLRPLEKRKETTTKAFVDIPDYLFVYGDVTNTVSLGSGITQSKVSIHEDASILAPGGLASYGNTYVGITFDNSKGCAYSTPGINFGLNGLGMGGFKLPRDWHMLSSPLSNAPLGFDYKTHNTNSYSSGDYSHGGYYNNPWVTVSSEFSWLNGDAGTTGDNRYWMYGWENSQSQNGNLNAATGNTWVDGYFPSRVADAVNNVTGFTFGQGCIEGTDEYGRYPYGMDFYTWYEPQYHWINFKRNGPNHWHSDPNDEYYLHDHINYVGSAENVNETTLITAKGYMAAISVQTQLQSHGSLNTGTKTIPLTSSGRYCKGWNLVGNPFHGYLDFDKFAKNAINTKLLAKDSSSNPFYVVYNADGYTDAPESAFIYYVQDGSLGGAYASQYLHPHQGFYVQMSETPDVSSGTNLQFIDGTDGMVVARKDGEAPFRDWRPNYPLVNLFLSSDNGCSDVTVIEFERPEWSGALKLRDLYVGNGQFYGYHDGNRYAALFAKTGVERVPLWFEAKEDDIFTMKWNMANGNFHSMYLIDNITGFQYDMLANNTYTFEGHKNDYHARFYIVFDLTDVEEFDDNDHNFVFFDGSQWVVTGDGDLDFIDVDGRMLWRGSVHGQTRVSLPKVAAGVYLFRLSNSNYVRMQKVIVKKD